jgi:hypothetical protein
LFGNVRQELLAILSAQSAKMMKFLTSELPITVIGKTIKQKWSENHMISSLEHG